MNVGLWLELRHPFGVPIRKTTLRHWTSKRAVWRFDDNVTHGFGPEQVIARENWTVERPRSSLSGASTPRTGIAIQCRCRAGSFPITRSNMRSPGAVWELFTVPGTCLSIDL